MPRRTTVGALIALALTTSMLLPSAAAAKPMKVLGTDPALDGAPAADLVSLAAATHGSDFHIQIGLAQALPVQGSYPGAGIEWAFEVRGRTFLAEAHPEPGEMRYTLFEISGDELRQVEILDGAFDTEAGLIDMYVPLQSIGARKGTKISGAGDGSTPDADIHQHAGPASRELDAMTTTSDFVVR
jgi:hypothetical protein